MSLVVISIPFMILGLAIAVAPLLWGMAHQHKHDRQERESVRADSLVEPGRRAFATAGSVTERDFDALQLRLEKIERELISSAASHGEPASEVAEAALAGFQLERVPYPPTVSP